MNNESLSERESDDKLHEECGIVGVFGHPEASRLIYLSLYALQHRGQEACGIVTLGDDERFRSHKAFGLVGDSFTREKIEIMIGSKGIGHNRYSTHGGRSMQNIQPFTFNSSVGPLAIAHNGNLTNAAELRTELEADGSIFQSTSDTEVFMHLIARSKSDDLLTRIKNAMGRVRGAYSLVILAKDRLFALRDPFGFRPLVLGQKDQCVVATSESCALDLIDMPLVREVEPGEVVEINATGIKSHRLDTTVKRTAFCAFEPIYFARPDSQIFQRRMYEIRKKLGAQLAAEDQTKDVDLVIAVPDSGVLMALGYADRAKIPYEVGLVRNHYVGRTFIEPTQAIRDFGVRLKLNPVRAVLEGKRVVVVDDSLVRGTTAMKILRMIRSAGAREIHLRIGSPPITHSCFFGVDTPKRQNLLAAQQSVQEMCDHIGADSLAFLSHSGLRSVLTDTDAQSFCYGCFGGGYVESIGESVTVEPTDASGGPGLRSF
jgi:amidophosphoribosyltransferase